MSALEVGFVDLPRFSAPALCAEVGGDEWLPEKRGTTRAAKAICARCEAREECLAYALTHRLDQAWDGVWGGTSPRERRAMRHAADAVTATVIAHPATLTPPTPPSRPWATGELRAAVRLLADCRMDAKEIARELGVPVAAVRRATA